MVLPKHNPSIDELAWVISANRQLQSAVRPPGPKGALIMGVMREFNRDQLGFIERAQRDYGDVVWMRFLYLPALFLYHPDDIEYVLTTNPKNFIKSMSLRSNFFHRLVGNGLLTSQGEEWKRARRLSSPAFHRERVASYATVMVDYTSRLTAKWQEGETRDIHPDMMRLTLEIVVQCLFSADVSHDVDHVGATLKELVKPFASQATLGWILNNRLPTPAHFRFHALAKKIDDVVYRIIAERRAGGKDEGDLLSMLLAARDEDGSQMSDRQLRDEVMTLFLAGHETTALTLAWSWYLLGTNPESERKFHAELDEVLGGRAPTAADLPRLRFTEQIAKESMRLYPPAYGLGREAINDCEIGGYRVTAGTQVFMFQWATQRDPRFYDEPLAFKPERWTEEFIERLPKYAYFPFGGGPRACIGASFAMMEIVLCLAVIGQKFRLELDPNHPVTIYPAMSLRPREGIRVVPHRRRQARSEILLLASLSLTWQIYQAYEQKAEIQRMSEQGFGTPCDLGSFLYSPVRMMIEVFLIVLFVGTMFRGVIGLLLSSVGCLGAGCIYVLWWREYFRQLRFVESEISLRLLREASPA